MNRPFSKKYDVKMTLNVEECLNDLSLLDGMQSVFISGVHSHERNIILKYCVGQGINVFVLPRVGDVIMSGAQPMHMFHLPMLRVGRYMASPEFLFVKRAMDIVISLAALVILSPLFLLRLLPSSPMVVRLFTSRFALPKTANRSRS